MTAIAELQTRTNIFGESETKQPLIDRNQLSSILSEQLSQLSLEQFIALFTNEFNETINYAELLQGKKTCYTTSLLFNPHRLVTRIIDGRESVYDALQDDSFVNGLARAIILGNKKRVKSWRLLQYALDLGVNGTQVAYEFQPIAARNLCLKYKLSSRSKVLDPCAGWGGRMLGISTITNYYECFDPSKLTYNGLGQLYKFIQKIRPGFTAMIHNLPFEDSKLDDCIYDFALTSPPYFNTEAYSDDPMDSATRYKTFDRWVEGFYLPLIQKTMNALKPGATFVLNIGSRKYPLNEVLLDNFDHEFQIGRLQNYLPTKGLGKKGEGETFYTLTKPMRQRRKRIS